ncbi:MAG TPA: CBS domain-containing protein [Candidatus Bathyarchaeia archaeon]|nr:CBS domain-containing protein [Candidatus Bathyarchaeia archaeon]
MEKNISSNSRLKMHVSEVMSSNVYSIDPHEFVIKAAKLMLDNNIGSIILQSTDGKKKALGIITERDIVTRVVAQGKDPSKTIVDDIATKPVVTIPPTIDITEAMTLMARLNIRRLIIVEKGNVIGIVTYRDLLRIAPSLFEIATEYENISFGNEQESFEKDFSDKDEEEYDKDSDSDNQGLSLGYYCCQCGEFCEGTPIYDADNQLVCSDCHDEEG